MAAACPVLNRPVLAGAAAVLLPNKPAPAGVAAVAAGALPNKPPGAGVVAAPVPDPNKPPVVEVVAAGML